MSAQSSAERCCGGLHLSRQYKLSVFAALIVVFGFAGGLVLSAVKRSLGVKDWGSAIAGHGGALDRLDSLSFSAPIFFHLVRYFFLSNPNSEVSPLSRSRRPRSVGVFCSEKSPIGPRLFCSVILIVKHQVFEDEHEDEA